MKKYLVTILATAFVVGNVVATICFKACGKRVNITDPKHWKVVDDDWKHIISLKLAEES